MVAIRVEGEGDRGRKPMDKLDKNIVRAQIGAGGLFYAKLSAASTMAIAPIMTKLQGRKDQR